MIDQNLTPYTDCKTFYVNDILSTGLATPIIPKDAIGLELAEVKRLII